MKISRAGGQEHGTLIGLPSAPFTAPSQSPVPVGLTPDENPNCGVKASIWARDKPLADVTEEVAGGAAAVVLGAGAAVVAGGATVVAGGAVWPF